MKLTKKQQVDLDTICYFIPSNVKFTPITDEDITRYFNWSDKGKGGARIKREAMQTNTGLSALYWGKQRRDLQVTQYIEDWGKYITATDFVDEPLFLVEWLSKVMKKRGILGMWRLFNDTDALTKQDLKDFVPFAKLAKLHLVVSDA